MTATAPSSRSKMTTIDSHKDPVFGLSITPNDAELAFRLARTADESGLDIIGRKHSQK